MFRTLSLDGKINFVFPFSKYLFPRTLLFTC